MILFFSFLCYKTTTSINSPQDAYILDDFGFYENGTFNVTFTDIETKNLSWALLTSFEFSLEIMLSAQAKKFCSGDSKPGILYEINGNNTYKISGIISKKDIYTPFVFNCAGQPMKVTIEQIFRNPDFFIDFRWVDGRIAQIVLIAYSVLFLVGWLINWFLHFRTNVKIHYFITMTLFLCVVYHTLGYKEIEILFDHDTAPSVTPVKIVMFTLYNACLYITLLLASKGWCIYKATLTCKDVFMPIFYVVVYNVFNGLLMFKPTGKFSVIWSIISIIAMVLLLRELIIGINKSRIHFMGHLLVISNAGITPKSTPIYAKYKLYILLKYSIIGCFVFIIIQVCVELFANPFFWIDRLIIEILQALILTVLCIIFRLKNTQSQDQYMQIYEGESDHEDTEVDNAEAPEVLQLSDIETLDIKKLSSKPGIQWEQGMKLPNPPVIKKVIIKNDVFMNHSIGNSRRTTQPQSGDLESLQQHQSSVDNNNNSRDLSLDDI